MVYYSAYLRLILCLFFHLYTYFIYIIYCNTFSLRSFWVWDTRHQLVAARQPRGHGLSGAGECRVRLRSRTLRVWPMKNSLVTLSPLYNRSMVTLWCWWNSDFSHSFEPDLCDMVTWLHWILTLDVIRCLRSKRSSPTGCNPKWPVQSQQRKLLPRPFHKLWTQLSIETDWNWVVVNIRLGWEQFVALFTAPAVVANFSVAYKICKICKTCHTCRIFSERLERKCENKEWERGENGFFKEWDIFFFHNEKYGNFYTPAFCSENFEISRHFPPGGTLG